MLSMFRRHKNMVKILCIGQSLKVWHRVKTQMKCHRMRHFIKVGAKVKTIGRDRDTSKPVTTYYEGCSNMNASSFITFVTYMLRQNGIRFYKGLYVTIKLAPNLKQNTVYLLSYRPLNKGHFSILTKSMLRTYQ